MMPQPQDRKTCTTFKTNTVKLRLTIDRFEGETNPLAVLLADNGRSMNFPREFLPKNARAGDVLTFQIETDHKATQRIARQTKKIQDKLKSKDSGGDIAL
jgi:hypothetical protein